MGSWRRYWHWGTRGQTYHRMFYHEYLLRRKYDYHLFRNYYYFLYSIYKQLLLCNVADALKNYRFPIIIPILICMVNPFMSFQRDFSACVCEKYGDLHVNIGFDERRSRWSQNCWLSLAVCTVHGVHDGMDKRLRPLSSLSDEAMDDFNVFPRRVNAMR